MSSIGAVSILGNILLFLLVFGMSAAVDRNHLIQQIHNTKGLVAGVFLQLFAMPFLGFLAVMTLGLDSNAGISLLVITSSPGGSFSNWWCSLFNAELALSVTMTAISTVMSVFMLPLNLFIYARSAYDVDVVSSLNWNSLFASLGVIISGVVLGLLASVKFHSHRFNFIANHIGNITGLALVLYWLAVTIMNADALMFKHDWKFYVGVAAPCILGLIVGNTVTTLCRLKRPERVALSIECCYQNVGISTLVALAMFEDDDLSTAISVPLFYGVVQSILVGLYCVTCWKMDWTKAPSDVPLCTAIGTSYEVLSAEKEESGEAGTYSGDKMSENRSIEEGGVGSRLALPPWMKASSNGAVTT